MSVYILFIFLSLIFLLSLYIVPFFPLCLSFVLRHLFCSLHNFVSVSRFRFEFAYLLSLSRWLISMISVLFLIWLYFVESIFSLKGPSIHPSIEKSRICRSRISAWLVDTSLVKLKTDPMSVWSDSHYWLHNNSNYNNHYWNINRNILSYFCMTPSNYKNHSYCLKPFLVGMLWEKSLKWPRTG